MFIKQGCLMLLGLLIVLNCFLGVGCAQSGQIEDIGKTLIPRVHPRLVLLKDGKVLILGGQMGQVSLQKYGLDPKAPVPNEIYDPITRKITFIRGLSNPENRFASAASLLPDGKILITGGSLLSYGSNGTSEIYDPDTGISLPGPDMLSSRKRHVAIALKNGNVLIMGGDPGKYINRKMKQLEKKWDLHQIELYDWKEKKFKIVGKTTSVANLIGANLLPDGRVLTGTQSNLEVYDPSTKKTIPAGHLIYGRVGSIWTTLSDGRVLIVGALNFEGPRRAEIYDPKTGKSKLTGTVKKMVFANAATLLPDGKVLVSGELNNVFRGTCLELFDPETGEFTLVKEYFNSFIGSTMLRLKDGSVLMLDAVDSNQPNIKIYIPKK